MARISARLVGLAVAVTAFYWALNGKRGDNWNLALIWCTPLLTFPISRLGRRALDRRPHAGSAERLNVVVHYAMVTALGAGLFPGFRLILMQPTIPSSPLRQVAWTLVALTGGAAFLSVVNLAARGLGAPLAVKLSSRLAIDWMYAWTRNPMLLSTLAWFLALGFWRQTVWGILWIAVSVAPGWVYFAKVYEERELEIRFGSAYAGYRARTPFLWPRRPGKLKDLEQMQDRGTIQ